MCKVWIGFNTYLRLWESPLNAPRAERKRILFFWFSTRLSIIECKYLFFCKSLFIKLYNKKRQSVFFKSLDENKRSYIALLSLDGCAQVIQFFSGVTTLAQHLCEPALVSNEISQQKRELGHAAQRVSNGLFAPSHYWSMQRNWGHYITLCGKTNHKSDMPDYGHQGREASRTPNVLPQWLRRSPRQHKVGHDTGVKIGSKSG